MIFGILEFYEKGKENMKKIMIAGICAFAVMMLHADICIKKGDKIAFMGDSITQGGNATPVGYVNLVMSGLKMFGVKDAVKIPAGISGHKSVQMHGRLERDVLSKKPQWMTFSCGVNDVWHGKSGVPLDKYKELVSDIFDRCDAAKVKVIVLTATMIFEDQNGELNQKLIPYNAWLREEAARRNYPLADLNADMQAELERIRKTDKKPGNKLTRDGVHMSFPGDVMMAWGVLRAMGAPEAEKARFVAMCRDIPDGAKMSISMSINEKERLDAMAKEKGMSINDYVRSLIFSAK